MPKLTLAQKQSRAKRRNVLNAQKEERIKLFLTRSQSETLTTRVGEIARLRGELDRTRERIQSVEEGINSFDEAYKPKRNELISSELTKMRKYDELIRLLGQENNKEKIIIKRIEEASNVIKNLLKAKAKGIKLVEKRPRTTLYDRQA